MRYPVLIDSYLFRGIGADEIERLLKLANSRQKLYREGSVIAFAGEEISALMIVLSGGVRGEMLDMKGKCIKIEDIKPPMAIAAAFIFGPGNRFPVNVVANSDTEILVIAKNDFMTLMQSDKRVLSNYLSIVCNKAVFLSDRLRFLSFRTIKGKLANYILSLPEVSGSTVRLDKTQEELADYFGVARPSIARALSGMEESGIISVKNRVIKIRDRMLLTGLTGD